ncbi:hypothetical protein ASD15_13765 [Massilia sp. Root351]|jgi:hypothetical protein|nr:hypothetical protein ASD15_13765 [Massilia sp. Root351]
MLHYSYPALGKRYESRAIGTSRVGNAGCERSEERLRERWGDLAPGTLLRARFDPQAPERAAIVVEKVDALDCVMILIGLIILCGSAWEIRNQMKR